jgi:sterol 3beta-glucosyltransferase
VEEVDAMRVLLLTLGTHGDVQPFVALGIGLAHAGHTVTVCTTSNFAPFVGAHGLVCAPLNPELVELTTGETGRRAIERFGGGVFGKARWIAEAGRRFKPIFRRLLAEQWAVARETRPDLLVFHPNAVGGVHLAEALGVPGVMADPMPTWVPTGAFPSFVFPEFPRGLPLLEPLRAAYNRLTYRLLPRVTRGMYGGVVARWRRETLGLRDAPSGGGDLARADGQPVPVLLAFSPQVVTRPADWPESVAVTGYWFLDASAGWTPTPALAAFLASGRPPIFVGFGSMVGRDPAWTARTVLDAVTRSGERALIVTGWGGLRVDDPPPGVHVVETVPYDWLLPRVSAVVHHGGAGTTAAGLRAGRPTVVCPFVADQPFWGARVAALGAGPAPIPQRRLTADALAAAIRVAVSDAAMRARAEHLGAAIRRENGVAAAVARVSNRLPAESNGSASSTS